MVLNSVGESSFIPMNTPSFNFQNLSIGDSTHDDDVSIHNYTWCETK